MDCGREGGQALQGSDSWMVVMRGMAGCLVGSKTLRMRTSWAGLPVPGLSGVKLSCVVVEREGVCEGVDVVCGGFT